MRMTSRDMVQGRGVPTYGTAAAAGDRPAQSPGDLEVPGLSGTAPWSTVPTKLTQEIET